MSTYRLAIPALAALLTPTLCAQSTWQKAGDQPAGRCAHHAFFDAPRGRLTVFGGQDSPTGRSVDCWQFDGRWARMNMPAVTPRAYGACCDDPLIPGTAIVFGGSNASGNLVPGTERWNRELHQFDTLTPVTTPPLRWITAMALDSSRQRAVLFGGGNQSGALGDTWEWNGSDWLQRSPAVSPPARGNHCMTYDAARNRVLLFGGHNGASRNDTWSWDGTTWTDVSGTIRPAPVHDAMMAFDYHRGRVVLFGGKNDLGIVNNTYWERATGDWTGPMQLTVSPRARELASLNYDPRRKALVLVGGVDQSGTLLNDVWDLDNNGWTQRSPLPVSTAAPAFERSNHAAAFAANRGRMVVFGGNNQNSTAVYNDTAETNGSAWQNRAPSPAPTGRTGARMVYAPSQSRCYMFGGRGISTFTDNLLWSWDGTAWTSTTGGASPPLARDGHGLAWDSARNKLVMFGGINTFGGTNETWEYDATSGWSLRSPALSPAARSGHAMVHAGIAGTYVFGGTIWNGTPTDQLWFWNGSNWSNLLPVARPPRVTGCCMCYDPDRDRLVMYGGIDGHFTNDQVYEYDGTTWTMQSPLSVARPWGRTGASLVYDSRYRRCVLSGGNSGLQYFNDVWEWDGSTRIWRERPHAGVPEPRSEHTLSHDPVRGRTVLFGGIDQDRTFDDTWEWNGNAWTAKVTVSGPPPRHSSMTAFEQWSGYTVLFGGSTAAGTAMNDTWEYDGTRWGQALVSAPSPRFNHAMVSLSPARGVFLYGGHNGVSQLADCFLWDGATWTQMPSGGGPRDIHAMAYDSLRNRVVVFGGRDQAGSHRNDTWEFLLANQTWVTRAPAQNPPARWNHAMTFDASRGRVVLTGGHSGLMALDDLWEWDGSNWLQRTPETHKPPAVLNSAITYDRGRGRCVSFGGDVSGGRSNELWEYSAVIDSAGAGNTANPSAMRYYTQPQLGEPLRLGITLPQNVGFFLLGFGPLQAPLLTIGDPALCEPANVWASLVTFLVIGSEPNFAWTVPNTPLIQGVTLVFQGASLQPGNCFRASDALQVQFR